MQTSNKFFNNRVIKEGLRSAAQVEDDMHWSGQVGWLANAVGENGAHIHISDTDVAFEEIFNPYQTPNA